MQAIEGALIAEVNDRVRKYQLQDLKCVRDDRIKADHLANLCACGGLFACCAKVDALSKDLRVLASIADAHDFKILRDTVRWVHTNSAHCS